MSERFQPGDVVYLKSGGMPMTVARPSPNNIMNTLIRICWMEGFRLQYDMLDPCMLTKTRPVFESEEPEPKKEESS